MLYEEPVSFFTDAASACLGYTPETDASLLQLVHESVTTTLKHEASDEKRIGLMYALFLMANRPEQRILCVSANMVTASYLLQRLRTALDNMRMGEHQRQATVKRMSKNYIGLANDSEVYFTFYKSSFQMPSACHLVFHDLYQYAKDDYKSRMIVSLKTIQSSSK